MLQRSALPPLAQAHIHIQSSSSCPLAALTDQAHGWDRNHGRWILEVGKKNTTLDHTVKCGAGKVARQVRALTGQAQGLNPDPSTHPSWALAMHSLTPACGRQRQGGLPGHQPSSCTSERSCIKGINQKALRQGILCPSQVSTWAYQPVCAYKYM